jgi:hypothetical protein
MSIVPVDIADLVKRTGLRWAERPVKPPQLSPVAEEWAFVGGDHISKNIGVAVGLVCSGRYCPPEWGFALGMLEIPPGANRIFLMQKGIQRDVARQAVAEMAVQVNARNLLFIDDDNPPPRDTVYKLMQTLDSADDDVAVCAGIYTTKTNPPSPLVFESEGSGPMWRWKRGDIFECGVIATGCMMIRTSALLKLPKPWFVDVTSVAQAKDLELLARDSHATHFEMTDDVYFCRKLRDAGFRLLAHGGVLPSHYDEFGNAYFLPDDSYPMVPR